MKNTSKFFSFPMVCLVAAMVAGGCRTPAEKKVVKLTNEAADKLAGQLLHNPQRSISKQDPILVATVAAIGVQLLGVRQYLPDVLHQILQILGGMALPLIMIILGGALYLDFHQGGKFYYGEVAKFLLIKNIIFPLVFLAILIFWRPSYGIALLFFLQSAIPPVTATPILTERAGGNKSISNQFVFASFVFSVFSVPAVFYLFNRFFPAP